MCPPKVPVKARQLYRSNVPLGRERDSLLKQQFRGIYGGNEGLSWKIGDAIDVSMSLFISNRLEITILIVEMKTCGKLAMPLIFLCRCSYPNV